MSEKEYTITELTEQLGVCKMTAYKLLRSGRIKARKRYGTTHSGDTWLVSQSALDEYKAYKNSRFAIPKITLIETRCENCGNEGLSVIVMCSNCNAVLYNKSYNKMQNDDAEKPWAAAIEDSPNLCPVCKAKIKK